MSPIPTLPIVYIFSVLRVAAALSSCPNQGSDPPITLAIESFLSTQLLSAVTTLSDPVPVASVLILAVPFTSKLVEGVLVPIPVFHPGEINKPFCDQSAVSANKAKEPEFV